MSMPSAKRPNWIERDGRIERDGKVLLICQSVQCTVKRF
jgi:hypothetical protein